MMDAIKSINRMFNMSNAIKSIKEIGLNCNNVDIFIELIKANLYLTEKGLDIKIDIKSQGFDRHYLTLKIDFIVNEKEKYAYDAQKLGLPIDIVGKKVIINNLPYTVTSLTRGKKKSVTVEDSEGNISEFEPSSISM
jgi:hypothetical protein